MSNASSQIYSKAIIETCFSVEDKLDNERYNQMLLEVRRIIKELIERTINYEDE